MQKDRIITTKRLSTITNVQTSYMQNCAQISDAFSEEMFEKQNWNVSHTLRLGIKISHLVEILAQILRQILQTWNKESITKVTVWHYQCNNNNK